MSFTASLEEIVSDNESGLLACHPTWVRCRLGDVAEVLNGFPFPSKQFNKAVGVPLLRIRDVTNGSTEAKYNGDYDAAYLVRQDDLVVGMDGDFNCALWRGPDAVLNQRVCKITTDENFYSKRLLFYALPGYLSAINASTSSVTVKHLSSLTVQDIPLPLPPVSEQGRIVAEIEKHLTRLDAAVAALKRAQVSLKRYRAAVLKAACEGRLVPTEAELARAEGREYEAADSLLAGILSQRRGKWESDEIMRMKGLGKSPRDDKWKTKYVEPVSPSEDELPAPAAGWAWATIDQCTIRVTDGEHLTPERSEDGIPLLSARNVRDGYLSLDEIDYVSETVYAELSRRLTIEAGDVLLSCSGSVGRSCIVPAGLVFSLVRSVAVLKPALSMGAFISYVLRSPQLQQQINEKKTQTAQSNIFQGKIKSLVIPLAPRQEQQRIIDELGRRLSVIDETDAFVTRSLKRADRMRQAILKQAFEGRLVDQDPNDEPAGDLLERIRSERVPLGDGRARVRRIDHKARAASDLTKLEEARG